MGDPETKLKHQRRRNLAARDMFKKKREMTHRSTKEYRRQKESLKEQEYGDLNDETWFTRESD